MNPELVQQLKTTLADLLTDHWLKMLTAVVLMGAGWVIGNYRARRRWARKEFLDRVNFSLNSIVDDTLQIRTLIEKDVSAVFLNQEACRRVSDAADRTTIANPILDFGPEETWFYLNSVVNEISEQFAEGFLLREMGLATAHRYTVCLTNEKDGNVNTRKLRPLVVRCETLESIGSRETEEQQPRFESPSHNTRWKTLRKMAAARQQAPWKFFDFELCVRS